MSSSIDYLRSLQSIRDQSNILLSHPHNLQCFDLDLTKIQSVVDKILFLIKRDYTSPADIPSHSRWRHFQNINLFTSISTTHKIDQAISMVDLFVVSVLLDAGAGDAWTYTSLSGKMNRSEGLAVASFDMFMKGVFSGQFLSSHYIKS